MLYGKVLLLVFISSGGSYFSKILAYFIQTWNCVANPHYNIDGLMQSSALLNSTNVQVHFKMQKKNG